MAVFSAAVTQSELEAAPPDRKVEPVQEIGRHQNADQRIADGIFMRQFVLGPKRLVIRQQVVALGFRQRPAVGALGESSRASRCFGSASARSFSKFRRVALMRSK